MTTRIAIASFAALLSCAAPRATNGSAPSGAPDQSAQIAGLFERETGPLQKAALVSSNGQTKGSVEAKGAPSVKAQGGQDEIEIPIGTGELIICSLLQSRIDGASTVVNFIGQLKGKLEMKPIKPIDVEMAGENPVLFSEYAYYVPAEGGKNVGHVKLGVVVHPRHSVICRHDEPGYAATFRRIVKGLASSMVTSGDGNLRTETDFAEVQIIKAGNQPVGFSETLLWRVKGGGFTWEHYSSIVMPRGDDLLATDNARNVSGDAAGTLQNEIFVSAVNGEITAKVALERQGTTNKYKYEGTQSGKPIAGEFATASGLASEVLQASLIRRDLLGGTVAQVEVDEYLASVNPVGSVHTVYRKDNPTSATISAKSKTLSYSLVPDATGWPQHLEIPMGPVTITFDRAWTHGSL